ncbi:MAG: trigger factor [Bacteroidota bacterium]
MATITREDIDALNVKLTIDVNKDDYIGDFKKELKRYRNQAQLKGFRKGKTPMTVIRKMFGRSILAEVVNKQMQEEMSEYLFNDENKLDFLGQPIPSEEQEEFEFSAANLDDYTFKFDLGLAPTFDLNGLDDGQTFEQLAVEPGEELLAEELMNLRRRSGSNEEVEGPVEERDIITLKAVEYKDDAAKEGGIEHEFTLFIDNITDVAKEAFLGAAIGDQAVLDVFNLENSTTDDHVRKYLLGLEEDDEREVEPTFQLTVDKISRNVPAELNEEFFANTFSEGDVTDEAGALDKIKSDYRKYFEKQSEALLFRDMQEHLMEQNPLSFPETFLKRWLVISNERNTPESVEKGFEGFTKGLQWTLIREKLIKEFELKVEEAELRDSFKQQVYGYFGGGQPEWLNEEMVSGMVDRMMNEEKSVREKADELMNDKISAALREKVVLTEKVVDQEAFQEIIAEAQAKAQAEAALIEEEE